jgi:hypothetical protein
MSTGVFLSLQMAWIWVQILPYSLYDLWNVSIAGIKYRYQ